MCSNSGKEPLALVIHGGAGLTKKLSAEREIECTAVLKAALKAGYDVLKDGGSAVDAVSTAVVVMEDNKNFNAGKGSVFSLDEVIEMDAGIMDGRTGAVGAVSLLKRVKNPVLAAVEVMRATPHCLLAAEEADAFAKRRGLVCFDDASYFQTETRLEHLRTLISSSKGEVRPIQDHEGESLSKGTVGACALDKWGNLACASSTGGLTGRMTGRVSDSSMAGAGFFCTKEVALSGTGDGDGFIRTSACSRAAHNYEFTIGKSLQTVVSEAVFEGLKNYSGGIIGLDNKGNVSCAFNCLGMFRAYIDANGDEFVGIYH